MFHGPNENLNVPFMTHLLVQPCFLHANAFAAVFNAATVFSS